LKENIRNIFQKNISTRHFFCLFSFFLKKKRNRFGFMDDSLITFRHFVSHKRGNAFLKVAPEKKRKNIINKQLFSASDPRTGRDTVTV